MEGDSRGDIVEYWGLRPQYSVMCPPRIPSMFNSLSNYSNYFKLDQTTLTTGLVRMVVRPKAAPPCLSMISLALALDLIPRQPITTDFECQTANGDARYSFKMCLLKTLSRPFYKAAFKRRLKGHWILRALSMGS